MPNELDAPSPAAPNDPDWQWTAYRQTQIICDLNAQLAAAEARAAVAERQSQQDRHIVGQSLKQLDSLKRDNVRRQRQFPDPKWVKLEDINTLIDMHLVERLITQQGLNKWFDKNPDESKVHGQKLGGRWLADLDSFKRVWESAGYPPLPWHRLRRVHPDADYDL